MSNEQILLVRWQVKEEALATVLPLLPRLQQSSQEEPGNLAYEIYQSESAPTVIFLKEVYTNKTAVEAHKASRHYQTIVVEKIIPLLSQREVHFVNPA